MQSFTIDELLPKKNITELKKRISETIWSDSIGEDTWDYGVPLSWLRKMADFWVNEWDWDGVSEEMDRWPHKISTIDGLPIHFIHAKAKDPEAPAIILSHGWPWTFWDFRDVIGPLSRPDDFGFNGQQPFSVVVPSLPGFGFSAPLRKAGVDVSKIASIWVELMTEQLGYQKFCAFGGDWGSLVTAHLAHAHPEKLIGAHLGLAVIPGLDRRSLSENDFDETEKWMIERNAESLPHITSHLAVHLQDPQTIGYALTDSPMGMAAWIWERRRNWSDCDGDIEKAFEKEHLCTTAALFWCTKTINSSLRLYHEHFKKGWPLINDRMPVLSAPTGLAVFPKDVVHLPKKVIERHCNLHHYAVLSKGGHFGPAEVPAELVNEIRKFFVPLI